jgi:hypothetical protein
MQDLLNLIRSMLLGLFRSKTVMRRAKGLPLRKACPESRRPQLRWRGLSGIIVCLLQAVRFGKTIANSRLCFDQRGGTRIGFDFGSELTDKDSQVLSVVLVSRAPYSRQDAGA